MTTNNVNYGAWTYYEISEQAAAMAGAYEEALNMKDWAKKYLSDSEIQQNLYIGSGSSYYQSITMAATYRSWLGREAIALPSSDLLLIRRQVAKDDLRTVVFGVSRSGESTEVVKALESVQALPSWTIAGVTCYGESAMAKQGDCLVTELGQEKSTVMTKSLASMIVGMQTAIALVANDTGRLKDMELLVATQAARVKESELLAKELVSQRHFDKTVFLGLGAMFGMAQEGCLKLKEMANVWTESYGTLEFRHGPKSIVDESTCIIVLVSEETRAAELKVTQEMKEYGAYVVVVTVEEGGDTAFADLVVPTGLSGAADEARATAILPFIQYYGYFTALKRGVNPDSPRNLTQVVKI